MKLSDEIKNKITEEYNEWFEHQYGGKTKSERQKLGQFFTPPILTIKMLEKFDNLNGNVLDPTVGCGGLLAAAIIAGANPKKCYGIELDPEILKLCHKRLGKLGVPEKNLILGDALNPEIYDKFEEYTEENNENINNKEALYIDINVKNSSMILYKLTIDNILNNSLKEYNIKFLDNNNYINIDKLYKIFKQVLSKNFYILSNKNIEKKLIILNKLFEKQNFEKLSFNNYFNLENFSTIENISNKCSELKITSFEDIKNYLNVNE